MVYICLTRVGVWCGCLLAFLSRCVTIQAFLRIDTSNESKRRKKCSCEGNFLKSHPFREIVAILFNWFEICWGHSSRSVGFYKGLCSLASFNHVLFAFSWKLLSFIVRGWWWMMDGRFVRCCLSVIFKFPKYSWTDESWAVVWIKMAGEGREKLILPERKCRPHYEQPWAWLSKYNIELHMHKYKDSRIQATAKSCGRCVGSAKRGLCQKDGCLPTPRRRPEEEGSSASRIAHQI